MNNNSSKTDSKLRLLTKGLAIVTLLLLVIPIIGWYFESPSLLKLIEISPPIPANTIVALVCSSTACLAITNNQKWLAIGCSIAVILIPIITQIFYFFGQDWNLGSYFFLSSEKFFTSMHARMPLNTAIGLILSGIALLFIIFHSLLFFSAIVGSITATLGVIGLIGLCSHILPAYKWSAIGGMTLYASVFLTGLGLAIIALASWAMKEKKGVSHPLHIFLPITLIFYLTTIGLYFALIFQKQADAHDTIKTTLPWMEKELSLDFAHIQENLSRLASALEIAPASPASAKQYASLSLDDQTGFQAIALVSPSYEMLWNIWATTQAYVNPLEEAIQNQITKLNTSKPISSVFRFQATDINQYGFLLFEPVVVENKLTGWLVGYLTDLQIFYGVLWDLHMSGYEIQIHQDNNTLLYESAMPPQMNSPLKNYLYEAPISLGTTTWFIRVIPGAALIMRMSSHLPEVVLSFGFALSTLVLVTIYNSFKIRENQKRSLYLEKQIETLIQESLDALITGNTERKQVGEALQESKARAEEASRSKSQFLARMSHEMRTPLTSVLGYCELLLSPETSPEQCISFARIIQHNGNYLLSLINDLLDVAEIESSTIKIDHTQCSPRKIVEEVAAAMLQFASAKKLFLKVEYEDPLPTYIYSDPKRITQILFKLISNAIRYTETGGVKIVVSKADQNNPPSHLQFSVIDTGIGIQKEVSSRLFQAFFQGVPSGSRVQKGVGLGLALAKTLTELLGGTIVYYSEPGFGSTFVATIATHLDKPYPEKLTTHSETLPQQSKTATPSITLLSNKRILLAEDNEDTQSLMTLHLKHAGAIVEAVDNGRLAYEKGVEVLKKNEPYDIILMDIDMPEMTGIEATQKLRDSGYHAPIIALTAYGTKEEADKCIASGCNEVLVKPVTRDVLIQKLSVYNSPKNSS